MARLKRKQAERARSQLHADALSQGAAVVSSELRSGAERPAASLKTRCCTKGKKGLPNRRKQLKSGRASENFMG